MNPMTLIVRQTWAQVVDAYRELSARRLFWLSLIISLVVVVFFAMFDFNQQGMKILGWQIPLTFFNTNIISREAFFKLLFSTFGFGVWLSWAAMALALISTAHVFPDFVASGSIELTLSKPLGRLRAFLVKYVLALMFVGVQVVVFTLASITVIGLRTGTWVWDFLLAVPIMMLIFSYLFCVSVLVGVITRSALTALLAAGIIWLLAFVVHLVETAGLLRGRMQWEAGQIAMVDGVKSRADKVRELDALLASQQPPSADTQSERERAAAELAEWEESFKDVSENVQSLTTAHNIIFGIKMFLPKTNETFDLLNRVLFRDDELTQLANARPVRERDTRWIGKVRVSNRAIDRELRERLAQRDEWWIIGTSGAFQIIVLGTAAWIFCRRDF